MRVITTETGRALQLFVMEEITPMSGVYTPGVYAAIGERYEFVSRPLDIREALTNGAKFAGGHRIIGERDIPVTEFGLFSDGILTATRSTDDADLVMDEFIEWATHAYKLRNPITQKPRTHSSTVVVEFDAPINALISDFSTIQALLAEAYERGNNRKIDLQLSKFVLQADPAQLPQFTNTEFMFERRVGIPFSANRFYCAAPLKTKDHLALLERLESALR